MTPTYDAISIDRAFPAVMAHPKERVKIVETKTGQNLGRFVGTKYGQAHVADWVESNYEAVANALEGSGLADEVLPEAMIRIGNTIYFSDQTADGSVICDSNTTQAEVRGIKIINITVCLNQAQVLAEHLMQNGIRATRDQFAFKVDPDTGLARVKMLDFNSGIGKAGVDEAYVPKLMSSVREVLERFK